MTFENFLEYGLYDMLIDIDQMPIEELGRDIRDVTIGQLTDLADELEETPADIFKKLAGFLENPDGIN